MAKQAAFTKVALLGPGLLGGSILKAIRHFQPECSLRVWARRWEVLDEVNQLGLADFTSLEVTKVVENADLVILALPIQHMKAVVEQFPALESNVIVTDVGSTKQSVVTSLTSIVAEKGGTFIGSHPMAGSEKTGLDSSRKDLFENAAVIVTPSESDADQHQASVDRLAAFWQMLGGRTELMSPADHDAAVASISHLPHLLASALVRNSLGRANSENDRLVGSGFLDSTRIAAGDPAMWTEIMTSNQIALLGEINHLIKELGNWKDALAALDKDALHQYLDQAKQLRESIS